jgi:hypothetical protein
MEIIVRSISSPVRVSRHELDGICIDFDSQAVCGSAVLIPVTPSHHFKVGDMLSVETGYESCSDFIITPPCPSPSVHYLQQLDSYQIHAPINQVDDDGVFYVDLEDCQFMVEPVENQQLQAGNWLQFRLHGLSLWQYIL